MSRGDGVIPLVQRVNKQVWGHWRGGYNCTRTVVEEVATNQIKIRFRLRSPREENVEELAESISTLGLLNPITIDNENFLIAGYHRLQAFQLLGIEKIPCIRKDFSRIYCELGEIAENLTRANLCRISAAEHMVRREELYEELGMRMKSGFNKNNEGMVTTKILQNYMEQVTVFTGRRRQHY